ncbi:MAG: hypothetical protein ACXVBW_08975, partial [Bdellovibrionota bacterium]
SSLTGGDVMAWLGANASAEFQYKKELANNDTNFLYKQVQMADSQEVWVTTAYLSESPQPEATETVTALGSQNLIVEYDASAMAPFHTGVTISAGDEYTLNASFTLAGQAPDIKGTSYFRWDPSWGSIDGDLYFRVGTGPWRKVNGRSSITDDSLHTGELQFYVDRTAIWNKLPAELRLPKHKFWAPILAFDKTYPTFQVQLSGRHIERR